MSSTGKKAAAGSKAAATMKCVSSSITHRKLWDINHGNKINAVVGQTINAGQTIDTVSVADVSNSISIYCMYPLDTVSSVDRDSCT